VAQAAGKRTLLTVHDAAIIVETLFPFTVTRRLPKPLCSIANRMSRLSDALFKRSLLNTLVRRASVVFSLAPGEVVFGRQTTYLPPPSYVERPRPYVPPATPVIGFVGFWGGAKGIETLIRALAILQDEGQKLRAVIGGSTGDPDDSYSRSVRGLAAELGVDAEFPGFIPDDQVESVFASLSAVVIPYLRDHPASSSGVAVWGLSLGVPIVASDIPALRRQLGDAAAYVDPGDAGALAAALRTVLGDHATAVRRAHDAQTRFYQEHSNDAISQLVAGHLDGRTPA
jgi:glycosyltransferase involved in cell wall biosynthesis